MVERKYTTVFCDMVRQETTGKHIIIGAYGGDLIPGALPQVLPVALWINFSPALVGKHKLEISVAATGGNESTVGVEINMAVPPIGEGSNTLAVGPLPIQVTEPGHVMAYLKIDNELREEVGRLSVLPVGTSPHSAS